MEPSKITPSVQAHYRPNLPELIAAQLRDMPEPTADQVQLILATLQCRLHEMHARGCHPWAGQAADCVLDAHAACDEAPEVCERLALDADMFRDMVRRSA